MLPWRDRSMLDGCEEGEAITGKMILPRFLVINDKAI